MFLKMPLLIEVKLICFSKIENTIHNVYGYKTKKMLDLSVSYFYLILDTVRREIHCKFGIRTNIHDEIQNLIDSGPTSSYLFRHATDMEHPS